MSLLSILLGIAAFALILLYSEGEFAGSAEEEARRIRFRRIGLLLLLISLLLRTWVEFA